MGVVEYAASYRAILDEATRIRDLPRKERRSERKNLKPLAIAVVEAQKGTSEPSRGQVIRSRVAQNEHPIGAVMRTTWEISKIMLARDSSRKQRG